MGMNFPSPYLGEGEKRIKRSVYEDPNFTMSRIEDVGSNNGCFLSFDAEGLLEMSCSRHAETNDTNSGG